MTEEGSSGPKRADIDTCAADWVARMDRGLVSAQDRERFAQWLSRDARHQGAYVRAQAAFHLVSRARALDPESLAGPAIEYPRGFEGYVTRRNLLAGGAVAASACIAAVMLFKPEARAENFVTDIGEIRRLRLEDGSILILNTDTSVWVRFSDHRRLVQLEKGEGLFEIAREPERPFIVSTRIADVRAIGTKFNVRDSAAATDVLVAEGVVEFQGASHQASAVRLRAGGEAALTIDGQLRTGLLTPDALMRRLAWREGAIVLDGETLAEAASEFERYNPVRIVIQDPQLASQTIVGRFDAGDPRSFAESAAQLYGARVVSTGSEIRIVAEARKKTI